MSKIQLNKHYGWVLLAATAIGLECHCTGFAVPMRTRAKYFNKEFMEQNFGEIHKREIGHEVPELGYPDMGNGIYSQKLPYKAWFEFNNAQRVHYQFVESIGNIIPTTLIAGLGFPRLAASLGAVYFIGRLLYTKGYTSEVGPNHRETGAIIFNVAYILSAGLALATGFRWVKYGIQMTVI